MQICIARLNKQSKHNRQMQNPPNLHSPLKSFVPEVPAVTLNASLVLLHSQPKKQKSGYRTLARRSRTFEVDGTQRTRPNKKKEQERGAGQTRTQGMRRSRAEFDLPNLEKGHSSCKKVRQMPKALDGSPQEGLAAPIGVPRSVSSGLPVVGVASLAHQEICFFLFQTALAAIHIEVCQKEKSCFPYLRKSMLSYQTFSFFRQCGCG